VSDAAERVTAFAIAALVRAGRRDEAGAALATMIAEETGLAVAGVRVTSDGYSLNSVTARVDLVDGRPLFAKLHTEEGEEHTVQEYYRARVLAAVGLPVDVPVASSTTPGRQVLLYEFRTAERMADVMRRADRGELDDATMARLLAAQADLDRAVGNAYVASLHEASAADVAGEAVHQLFAHRLAPGGRLDRFYRQRAEPVPLARDLAVPWAELAELRWVVDGRAHAHTLGEVFAEAGARLAPGALGGVAVGHHGDAHDANVWVTPEGLRWFDPAFAGAHVPALLAEVKPTFHNVWAHPDWLYHPAGTAAGARVTRRGGELHVTLGWSLPAVRIRRLASTVTHVWTPLLAAMAARGLLDADWERTVRCALACCPSLVLDLASPVRRPEVIALGFAMTLMLASPADEPSPIDAMFSSLRQSLPA
jgi:hypothetical protein